MKDSHSALGRGLTLLYVYLHYIVYCLVTFVLINSAKNKRQKIQNLIPVWNNEASSIWKPKEALYAGSESFLIKMDEIKEKSVVLIFRKHFLFYMKETLLGPLPCVNFTIEHKHCNGCI